MTSSGEWRVESEELRSTIRRAGANPYPASVKSERRYHSVERRPIEVYVFGSGPKTTLIMAGVHGDEQRGVDIVRSIHSILSETSPDVLDGRRIVLMPCANPDGYAANTRQNANGVDINRNFPDKTFGTGKKSRKFYGGKVAASEPETQAIMHVVNEHRPQLIVSIHSSLACVNYNGPCVRIARRISKATGLPVVGDIGYPCPGSMGNYYGFDMRLPVITLELPREDVDVSDYPGILLEVLGIRKC